MITTESKADLLQKVRALAERGSGGEKDAAARILNRLMKKYGITEDDLRDDTAEIREFRWSKPYEDKLIHQIAYMVMGKNKAYKYKNSRKKVELIQCTKAQQMEILAAFEFYRRHLSDGMKSYYLAFIQAEGIYPDATKERDEGATVINDAAARMAMVMDRHERLPALEEGGART